MTTRIFLHSPENVEEEEINQDKSAFDVVQESLEAISTDIGLPIRLDENGQVRFSFEDNSIFMTAKKHHKIFRIMSPILDVNSYPLAFRSRIMTVVLKYGYLGQESRQTAFTIGSIPETGLDFGESELIVYYADTKTTCTKVHIKNIIENFIDTTLTVKNMIKKEFDDYNQILARVQGQVSISSQ